MNQRTLKRLCTLWQKRLNLVDWTLKPRFVDQETMAEKVDGRSVGGCIWCSDRKTADLYILSSERLHTLDDEGQEEHILLHELLHIVLEGHGPPKKSDIHVERAIHQLTAALLIAYKRRKTRG
jgi:hypothetical protein